MAKSLILASKSPRRKELLSLAGFSFTIETQDTSEYFDAQCTKHEAMMKIAREKAEVVYRKHPEAIVLGADTLVVCEDTIMGKAHTSDQAIAMLQKLSGKTHQVITGVCVISDELTEMFAVETSVTFYDLDLAWIKAYVNSGQAKDKAGAYGIQDQGALMVKGIQGDFYNVVGLPLSECTKCLKNKFNLNNKIV